MRAKQSATVYAYLDALGLISRAFSASFLFLLLGPQIAKGQETRTLAELECSFTLPDQNWEWLDPRLFAAAAVPPILVSRDDTGLFFSLSVQQLEPDEPRSYEQFAAGYFRDGRIKRIGARPIIFKGVPSYVLEGEVNGVGMTEVLIYANERQYGLNVINRNGPLDFERDVQPIIDRFAFTSAPRPSGKIGDATPTETEKAYERGRLAAKGTLAAAFLAIVCIGAIYITRRRSRRSTRGSGRAPTSKDGNANATEEVDGAPEVKPSE